MREREYLNSYSPEHFRFVRQSQPRLNRTDFAGHRPVWQGYAVGLIMALAVIALAGWLA